MAELIINQFRAIVDDVDADDIDADDIDTQLTELFAQATAESLKELLQFVSQRAKDASETHPTYSTDVVEPLIRASLENSEDNSVAFKLFSALDEFPRVPACRHPLTCEDIRTGMYTRELESLIKSMKKESLIALMRWLDKEWITLHLSPALMTTIIVNCYEKEVFPRDQLLLMVSECIID